MWTHGACLRRACIAALRQEANSNPKTTEPTEGELKAILARIAEIKDHEFKTWRTTPVHTRGSNPCRMITKSRNQDVLLRFPDWANNSNTRRKASKFAMTYEARVGPRPMCTVQAPDWIRSNRSSSVRSSPAAKIKSGSERVARRRSRTSPLLAQAGFT